MERKNYQGSIVSLSFGKDHSYVRDTGEAERAKKRSERTWKRLARDRKIRNNRKVNPR